MSIFGKSYNTNELYVAVLGDHQAFMLDENGKWDGTSKAIEISKKDIVKIEGNTHVSVATNEVYDQTKRDPEGFPEQIFVMNTIPFNEYFADYNKAKISQKGVDSLYNQLNNLNNETEETPEL